MKKIPHPFVKETMKLFHDFSNKEKIYFIHFNHTNPLIFEESTEKNELIKSGFNIAEEGQIIRCL